MTLQTNYQRLQDNLAYLKLKQCMLHLDETIELANTQSLSHIEWLLKLSDYEVDIKRQNVINHMVKISNFPHLKTLADFEFSFQPQINETVSKYGLRCVNFAISYMEPDQTKYDAIDEAQIERIKREKQGIGENAFMNQLGSNWDKMKRASIIETLAQNEGAGNITAMGAGLGMAMGVGSTIGNMANQVFQNASEMQNMQSYEDPIVVLEKLKKLLAAGLITEEDYDTKKKEVLSRM